MFQTAGYFAAFIVLGAAVAALGPTLPDLAQQTHTALGAISLLFTARSLGYLLGALQGGAVYDRLPGHPVMAGVLVLMALALALVPLPHVLWLLVAIVLVLGLGEGVVEVGSNAMLLWVHRHNASPFVNGLHFFFGVGAFLAPIVVAWVARLAGQGTPAYWLIALLALPVAGWLLWLPSPARQAAAAAGPQAARVDYRLVALVAVFFFLYAGIEQSFGGWIYSYATARQLAGESAAALLASAFWGAITVGRLLAIPLAARVKPVNLILADLGGVLVSLGLFWLFPGSPSMVWVAAVGLGLCLASIVPTTLAFVGQRMAVTGLATGAFFVGLGLGGMTIPLLIGQFFERVGPVILIATLSVDLIVSLGLFALMRIYTGRRTVAQEGAESLGF